MPVGAAIFAEALEMDRRGLPRRRRADGRSAAARRRRRRRRLVADFDDQRGGARDARRARSSAPASRRATRSRSRSTSPPPSSAATAATGSASTAASSTPTALIELLLRWIDALPDRVDRGPVRRGRRRRVRALSRGRRRPRADRRRRLPRRSNAPLIARGRASARCNAVLLKPNQARHADRDARGLDAAQRRRLRRRSSRRARARPRTSTIVHLAVGWKAGQLKVGSFARGERMAKWNEVLRIEEELGAGRALCGCGRPRGLQVALTHGPGICLSRRQEVEAMFCPQCGTVLRRAAGSAATAAAAARRVHRRRDAEHGATRARSLQCDRSDARPARPLIPRLH